MRLGRIESVWMSTFVDCYVCVGGAIGAWVMVRERSYHELDGNLLGRSREEEAQKIRRPHRSPEKNTGEVL